MIKAGCLLHRLGKRARPLWLVSMHAYCSLQNTCLFAHQSGPSVGSQARREWNAPIQFSCSCSIPESLTLEKTRYYFRYLPCCFMQLMQSHRVFFGDFRRFDSDLTRPCWFSPTLLSVTKLRAGLFVGSLSWGPLQGQLSGLIQRPLLLLYCCFQRCWLKWWKTNQT